mmetsp:Transcript_8025/g.20235  ORF Transcript_8025/g.20235 Transcript_8025/m.20235 type:complete len:865 (+) Transcript_8025:175-2769(+)
MAETATEVYQLAAQLPVCEGRVRALCSFTHRFVSSSSSSSFSSSSSSAPEYASESNQTATTRGILAAGEDATLRCFLSSSIQTSDTEEREEFHLVGEMRGHSELITHIMMLPDETTDSNLPAQRCVTCSLDHELIVWDLRRFELLQRLKGHMDVVSCAVYDPVRRCIYSASWDRTVRRWAQSSVGNFEVDLVLEEHTVAVNALLAGSNGVLYSGAGDKTVRRWDLASGSPLGVTELSPVAGAETEFVYATVRSFAEVPPSGESTVGSGVAKGGVLAACGDRVIRLFSYDCVLLTVFLGHTSFIFTVKSLSASAQMFMSGGDDCNLRIWKKGSTQQSLLHPGPIWQSDCLSNGDLLTACGDGMVRIWTRSQSRMADSAVVSAYQITCEQHIRELASQGSGAGSLDVSSLPDATSLLSSAATDGEVRLVQHEGRAMALKWSSAEKSWTEIELSEQELRDLLRAQANTVDGIQYDRVIDIAGPGGGKYRVGVNYGDNSYIVAQKFIDAHDEIGQHFLDQVAKFIDAQLEQPAGPVLGITKPAAGDRYAHQPSPTPAPAATTLAPMDTTGEHYSSAGVVHSPTPAVSMWFPLKQALIFDHVAPAALTKIRTLNEAFAQQSSPEGVRALTPSQFGVVSQVFSVLESTAMYHASSLPANGVETVLLCLLWPADSNFPALDILRLLALHHEGVKSFFKSFPLTQGSTLLHYLVDRFFHSEATTPQLMLVTRTLTNLCKFNEGRQAICTHHLTHWLHLLEQLLPSPAMPAVRLSLVSLLLNLVFSGHSCGWTEESQSVAFRLAVSLLEREHDPECCLRVLITVASMVVWYPRLKPDLPMDLITRVSASVRTSPIQTTISAVIVDLTRYHASL